MPSFLHVGCGPQRKPQTTRGFNTPEWTEVRLDIDPAVKPDIIGTMTDMSAVETASMDAVFSKHNIEHLYLHEVPVALGEFRRVLKPDGIAVVVCPDIQAVAALVAQGKLHEPAYVSGAGPISPHDTMYGYGRAMAAGNLYMAHRCGFTHDSLLQSLEKAGFASVGAVRRPALFELQAIASNRPLARESMLALIDAHFRIPGAKSVDQAGPPA